MHYCAAKVQRNYNYYNGYFNECLRWSMSKHTKNTRQLEIQRLPGMNAAKIDIISIPCKYLIGKYTIKYNKKPASSLFQFAEYVCFELADNVVPFFLCGVCAIGEVLVQDAVNKIMIVKEPNIEVFVYA